MNELARLSLQAWIPLALILFTLLPPRRAILVGLFAGWMFLPVVQIPFRGFVSLDKTIVTTTGAFLGALFFDSARLLRVRPAWVDAPILLWCLVPLVTSVGNDLGLYDGISTSVSRAVPLLFAWWIGRAYFADRAGLDELARAFVLSGVVYAPLCLWEVRMGPLLHEDLYGVFQHAFAQVHRAGGFRPIVFMDHSLMVAMWMACATLLSITAWKRGERRLGPLPLGAVIGLLGVTTLLCKTLGPIVLLCVGYLALASTRRLRTALVPVGLVGLALGYLALRASGLWSGLDVVELARPLSEERADSLAYRLDSEVLLAAHARESPWIGWGGWGRSFVTRDEEGYIGVIVDSAWIILFGQFGLLGLAAWLGILIAPIAHFVRRVPPVQWVRSGAAGALSIVVLIYLIDSLVNFMDHPIYYVIAGGIAGVGGAVAGLRAPPARAQRPVVAEALR